MSFLLMSDVEVSYPESDHVALKIDKLKIDEGESVLITGKSGSGKSTLVNLITGIIPKLIEADVKGEIRVFGRNISEYSLAKLSTLVCYLFQDPESQILNYYVKDEIAFGLENLNYPKEEILKRIEKYSNVIGISHLLNRETFYLSGGEKQRVVLASILAVEPRAIILDEPTSSIDSKGTREILQNINYLKNKMKLTMIIVEHKVDKVIKFVDRVIIVDEGRIVYDLSKEKFESFDYRELDKLGIESSKSFNCVKKREKYSEIFLKAYVKVSKGDKVIVDTKIEVYRGITALMGINGSGKSTLLKAIVGILDKGLSFQGYVNALGKDYTNASIETRGEIMAYLPQDVDLLFIKRTVEDEIKYSMKLRNKYDKEVLEKYLRNFSLDKVRNVDPFLLSVGQKRRLALASLLASGVKIFLLDEPTTGQDWYHRKKLGEELRSIKDVAFLVVTHDPKFVECFADRLLIMDNGRIVLEGDPDDIIPIADKYGVII
ncbi:MAG: ATP-binding cassette domain-containing protein [Saccharolobus sp.]